jgi:hypothetical protein
MKWEKVRRVKIGFCISLSLFFLCAEYILRSNNASPGGEGEKGDVMLRFQRALSFPFFSVR